jgi:hypothetical protein
VVGRLRDLEADGPRIPAELGQLTSAVALCGWLGSNRAHRPDPRAVVRHVCPHHAVDGGQRGRRLRGRRRHSAAARQAVAADWSRCPPCAWTRTGCPVPSRPSSLATGQTSPRSCAWNDDNELTGPNPFLSRRAVAVIAAGAPLGRHPAAGRVMPPEVCVRARPPPAAPAHPGRRPCAATTLKAAAAD